METNTRRFNTAAGIAVGVLAGAVGWVVLVGTAMWAVSL